MTSSHKSDRMTSGAVRGWRGLPGLSRRASRLCPRSATAFALTVSLFTLPVPAMRGIDGAEPSHVVVLIIGLLLAVTFLAPLLSNKAERYWVGLPTRPSLATATLTFSVCFPLTVSGRWICVSTRQECLYQKMMTGSIFCPRVLDCPRRQRAHERVPGAGRRCFRAFTGLVYVFVCFKAWAGAFGVGSIAQYVGGCYCAVRRPFRTGFRTGPCAITRFSALYV